MDGRATCGGGKYLTFCMAGEEYGIGILKVKEIIGMMPATKVPRAPVFVKGVVPSPSFGSSVNTQCIEGMAKKDRGVKILLEIDRVLSSEELCSLDEAV